MHDERLGFYFGEKRDIWEHVCPRWPHAHAGAYASHPCSMPHPNYRGYRHIPLLVGLSSYEQVIQHMQSMLQTTCMRKLLSVFTSKVCAASKTQFCAALVHVN